MTLVPGPGEHRALYEDIASVHRSRRTIKPNSPSGSPWKAGDSTEALSSFLRSTLQTHPELLKPPSSLFFKGHSSISASDTLACSVFEFSKAQNDSSLHTVSSGQCEQIQTFRSIRKELSDALHFEELGQTFSIWNPTLQTAEERKNILQLAKSLAKLGLHSGYIDLVVNRDATLLADAVEDALLLSEEMKHQGDIRSFETALEIQNQVIFAIEHSLDTYPTLHLPQRARIAKFLTHIVRYPDPVPMLHQGQYLYIFGAFFHSDSTLSRPFASLEHGDEFDIQTWSLARRLRVGYRFNDFWRWNSQAVQSIPEAFHERVVWSFQRSTEFRFLTHPEAVEKIGRGSRLRSVDFSLTHFKLKACTLAFGLAHNPKRPKQLANDPQLSICDKVAHGTASFWIEEKPPFLYAKGRWVIHSHHDLNFEESFDWRIEERL